MLPQWTDRAPKIPTRPPLSATPTPTATALSNTTHATTPFGTRTLRASLLQHGQIQQQLGAIPTAAQERTFRRQRHAAARMHECALTAEQEAQIFSAFEFLAIRNLEEYEKERPMGVLPVEDLNTVLELLDIFVDEEALYTIQGIIDPLDSGFVAYNTLCQYIALRKWHPGSDSTSSSEAGFGQHDVIKEPATSDSPDVHAFLAREKQDIHSLFQYMTRDSNTPTAGQDAAQDQPQTLTITHLRQIKKVVDKKTSPLVLSRSMLQLDGDPDEGEGKPGEDWDADLKAMILDANLSEDRTNGWRVGITFQEFENSMRRLSMFTTETNH